MVKQNAENNPTSLIESGCIETEQVKLFYSELEKKVSKILKRRLENQNP